MTCKKLEGKNDKKTLCKNLVSHNNAQVRVRTKCRKTCDNCKVGCVENCEDNSSFRWEEGGTKVGCTWLTGGGDNRRNENCERTVTGAASYSSETCVLEEKCPRSCKNCCGVNV